MLLTIHCLGASREVGRSAFIFETDKRVLLDYGIKIYDISGKPTYPLDIDMPLDAVILSHAHLDHSGFIPYLYKFSKTRWYATPPTYDICELLFQDSMKIMGEELPYNESHFKKAMKFWNPLLYGQSLQLGHTTYRFSDAGHIAGAAMVHIEYEGKNIVYTGDFKLQETYMHKGAKPPKDIDVLVMESTYHDREHPDRIELERKLVDEIEETVSEGGSVLFPAFAVGRSQELIMMIRQHLKDIPLYIDGMGKDVTNIYKKYSDYLKDPKAYNEACEKIIMVEEMNERKKATREPSVIISTAGMLEGGPALGYLKNLNAESKVIFTGYCIEGTNGWQLLNRGEITIEGKRVSVELPVEYFDFSAHAGKRDLLKTVKSANAEKIVLVHGDAPERYAKMLKEEYGFDAVAPKIGEKVNYL